MTDFIQIISKWHDVHISKTKVYKNYSLYSKSLLPKWCQDMIHKQMTRIKIRDNKKVGDKAAVYWGYG